MSAPPVYRRNYLVKPGFQIKHALTIFVNILIYAIILGFIIFYPLYGELYSTTNFEEQARISAIVLYLHKRFWAGLFVVALLAGINAIFSTHRVVGPVYRFEKMLEDIISGNYAKRIRIRKRDEFKEVESLLNRLAESLEMTKACEDRFHADLKNRLEAIHAMLHAVGEKHPAEAGRLIRAIIDDIGAHKCP